jgi:chromosome segregation ATPase
MLTQMHVQDLQPKLESLKAIFRGNADKYASCAQHEWTQTETVQGSHEQGQQELQKLRRAVEEMRDQNSSAEARLEQEQKEVLSESHSLNVRTHLVSGAPSETHTSLDWTVMPAHRKSHCAPNCDPVNDSSWVLQDKLKMMVPNAERMQSALEAKVKGLKKQLFEETKRANEDTARVLKQAERLSNTLRCISKHYEEDMGSLRAMLHETCVRVESDTSANLACMEAVKRMVSPCMKGVKGDLIAAEWV